MDAYEHKEKYFCFFTIYNQLSEIITISFLGLSLFLVLYGLKSYLKLVLLKNRDILLIYHMIVSWWITFILYHIYGICMFALFNDEESKNEDASFYSKFLFTLSWLNAYLMQLLLLYVPYYLAKLIVRLFYKPQSDGHSQHQYNGYEQKIQTLLRNYIKIRLLFIILPILFLSLQDQDAVNILFKLIISSLSLDCIIIIASLSFGIISLKKNAQLKENLDEQSLKRLFYKYLLIIIANIFRFAFDITHIISKIFNDQSFSAICPHFNEKNFTEDVVFQVFECLFTQFLPILMILRIFKYQQQQHQKTDATKSFIMSVSSQQDQNAIN